MKRKILFTPIVLCLFLSMQFAHAERLPLTVVQVEDGDTLIVRTDKGTERLQLLGIDAPEDTDNAKLTRDMSVTGLGREQLIALGQAATRHLGMLVAPGDVVSIEGNLDKRDRYGRVPAIVFVTHERPVNEAMVADGYAVIMRRYPMGSELQGRLEAAESAAFGAGRGLWGSHPAEMSAWSGHHGKK